MNKAEIRKTTGTWKPDDIFMLLRAFHYLAEFENVSDISLSCPEPPEAVCRTWQTSFDLKKRIVTIHYGVSMQDTPEFTAPDFPVRLNGRQIINIGIPDIPNLTDFHVHTPLAYCSENMDIPIAVALEHLSGVKHVNFSEHSGQLFCTSETYWSNRFVWRTRDARNDRSSLYAGLARTGVETGGSFGLELDVDENADVADMSHSALSGFRLGAIHFLGNDLTYEEKKRDFMRRLDALTASGIDILAHPFRVFLKGGLPIPEDLFEPVAEKLVRAHIAAEINFHTNRPQPEFVMLMLKKGGKISFGTDSHNLYEAGYLKPHYEFCKQLGIAGKLDEILLSGVDPRATEMGCC